VFAIVVAVDEERGIGKSGGLPWRIPADMAFFRALTQGSEAGAANAVIMGRATWDSIPERFRPLPGRHNIVLSRRGLDAVPAGATVVGSLAEALAEAAGSPRIFVIGGAQIYREALAHPECETLYLTRVNGTHGCDTFFPPWEESYRLVETLDQGTSGGENYRVEIWQRP